MAPPLLQFAASTSSNMAFRAPLFLGLSSMGEIGPHNAREIFSRVLTGVRPMIERYPLEKAAEGYQQMITGRARFRVVLTMGA